MLLRWNFVPTLLPICCSRSCKKKKKAGECNECCKLHIPKHLFFSNNNSKQQQHFNCCIDTATKSKSDFFFFYWQCTPYRISNFASLSLVYSMMQEVVGSNPISALDFVSRLHVPSLPLHTFIVGAPTFPHSRKMEALGQVAPLNCL